MIKKEREELRERLNNELIRTGSPHLCTKPPKKIKTRLSAVKGKKK